MFPIIMRIVDPCAHGRAHLDGFTHTHTRLRPILGDNTMQATSYRAVYDPNLTDLR